MNKTTLSSYLTLNIYSTYLKKKKTTRWHWSTYLKFVVHLCNFPVINNCSMLLKIICYTWHICRVSHRLAGPTVCGTHQSVSDLAYMSGTSRGVARNLYMGEPIWRLKSMTMSIIIVWIVYIFRLIWSFFEISSSDFIFFVGRKFT